LLHGISRDDTAEKLVLQKLVQKAIYLQQGGVAVAFVEVVFQYGFDVLAVNVFQPIVLLVLF